MTTTFEKFLLMLLLVLPIFTMIFTDFQVRHRYDQLLNDAGIDLRRHYVEVDGVRSNWVEIVYLNKGQEVQ